MSPAESALTTRRALIAGVAGATAIAAATSVIARSLPENGDLFREADEVDRLGDIVNTTSPISDKAIDTWAAAQDRFFDKVEALPVTLENNGVRLRALRSLHAGPDGFAEMGRDAETSDVRLAVQVLAAMQGAH